MTLIPCICQPRTLGMLDWFESSVLSWGLTLHPWHLCGKSLPSSKHSSKGTSSMGLSLILPHSELIILSLLELCTTVKYLLQSPLAGDNPLGILYFPQMWPKITEKTNVLREQRLCLFNFSGPTKGSRTHRFSTERLLDCTK